MTPLSGSKAAMTPLFSMYNCSCIVGAPDDCGLLLAFFHGLHGRQRLVLDGHRFNRLSQLVTVGMGQKQNRLFGVIHGLGGETRLIIQNQGDAILPWNIFGRYDDKIVPINA